MIDASRASEEPEGFVSTFSKFVRRLVADSQTKALQDERSFKKLAKQKGFYVYPVRTGWVDDEDFKRAKARDIVGIPDPSCFVLQSIIRGLHSVDGDVAEFGVRYGKSTTFMLEADRRDRRYHLFDSFEGLSEPTAQDIVASTGKSAWKRGDITALEEVARSNLKAYSNVQLYKGWIPERFQEAEDRRFALLHVDVDLYEPTRDSLSFFWPRLVQGGVVVCDDYGSIMCPGARRAVDEVVKENNAFLIELPTQQAIVLKR
jgi:hypothetical protein